MSIKRSYTGQCFWSGQGSGFQASFLSENAVRKSGVRDTLFDYYPDMLIGDARVSTDDQNLDALKAAGAGRLFAYAITDTVPSSTASWTSSALSILRARHMPRLTGPPSRRPLNAASAASAMLSCFRGTRIGTTAPGE